MVSTAAERTVVCTENLSVSHHGFEESTYKFPRKMVGGDTLSLVFMENLISVSP